MNNNGNTNMDNAAGGAPEKNGAYAARKRSFSIVGFACLAVLVLNFGLQELIFRLGNAYFPAVAAADWFYWGIHILVLYCISMPVGMLILRMVPTSPAPEGARSLMAGELGVALLMCYPLMYIGNYISSIINNALYSVLGKASNSGLFALTNDAPLWAILGVMVILGPIMEELFFRKFLIDRLRPYGEGLAVWLTASIFGLFHGNLEQFLYATLLGALLGFIYIRSGSIRSTMLLHMAVNFIGGFLPSLLFKYALDIGKLESFAETYGDMAASDMTPDMVSELIGTFGAIIPGLAWMMLYAGFVMGLALTGMVLLIVYNKKFRVSGPAPDEVEKRYIGDTVFMTPGILLFIVSSIALAVYTVLVTG